MVCLCRIGVSIGTTASSCVPGEWTVLKCRGAVSGCLVPGPRVLETGMMVWHWESGCPIHGIAHLVLVISAVAVTRCRHSSARKQRSICITLICPSAHRYCEEVLFGTIRICILSQPGPVLWVAHAKAGATRPGTAPRDRGPRAEGEGAILGGQQ